MPESRQLIRIERIQEAEPIRLTVVHGFDLPPQLTTFVGRRAAINAIESLLQEPDVRLLTLTGPGGVGKTRLALRVAERMATAFADGVLFVPLAAVVDPALVLPTIGKSAGVDGDDDRPLLARLLAAFEYRQMLIVLDNVEQIVSVAPQLAELLRRSPGITMLVTSRIPLRISGEREFPVPPLSVPESDTGQAGQDAVAESVALFALRARAVDPAFEITEQNLATISEICRKLDGLPLALELAAARVKLLPPRTLLDWLEQPLHILTGGPADLPSRQRTMRDAIAWSYGLLTPEQQEIFRRLSVFRSGFDLRSASVVVDDGSRMVSSETLDAISALLDQSLLVRDQDEGGQTRFRMLKTISDYGREELQKSGAEPEIFHRFCAYWITRAEAVWKETGNLQSLSQATSELAPDQDNLRAALDWLEVNDLPRAMQLAGALFWFWYVRGHHSEGLARCDQLLAYSRFGMAPGDVARALLVAGAFAHFQGRSDIELPRLTEALELFRQVGDDWGIGFTLMVLGIISEDAADFARAAPIFEEALISLDRSGDHGSAGSARYHLAVVAYGQHDYDRAEALLAEVLDPTKERLRIASWGMLLRALLMLERGKLDEALSAGQDGLRQFSAAHYSAGRSESIASLACIASAAGQHELAVTLMSVAARENELRGDDFELPEQTVYDAAVTRSREALTPVQIDDAWALGRSWTIDEATQVALAMTIEPPAPSPTALMVERGGNPRGLSKREHEVLKLLIEGMTSDQIAARLYLSPRTVHTHLASIYRKLNVSNRAEAISIAITQGLA